MRVSGGDLCEAEAPTEPAGEIVVPYIDFVILSDAKNNSNDGLKRILLYYNDSVEKKSLKIKKFTCHNFRHTFASKCAIKGVSERATKGLLGHTPDKRDVTNRYIHVSFEYLLSEANKLSEDNQIESHTIIKQPGER